MFSRESDRIGLFSLILSRICAEHRRKTIKSHSNTITYKEWKNGNDTLHTESREAVANDIIETLKIGERKNNGKANVEHTLRQLVYHKSNCQICIYQQTEHCRYFMILMFAKCFTIKNLVCI